MRTGSGKGSTMKTSWFVWFTVRARRLAGYIARMEECRSAFKILTGKPIRKGTILQWILKK